MAIMANIIGKINYPRPYGRGIHVVQASLVPLRGVLHPAITMVEVFVYRSV